jgi:hypothetical protein
VGNREIDKRCRNIGRVPSFQRHAKCSKCGGKRVDVRPNWKEAPGMPDSWQGRSAWEK